MQKAFAHAGLDGTTVDRAEVYLAGVDFPNEKEIATAALARRGWARDVTVDNDSFALLRAGLIRAAERDLPDAAVAELRELVALTYPDVGAG